MLVTGNIRYTAERTVSTGDNDVEEVGKQDGTVHAFAMKWVVLGV